MCILLNVYITHLIRQRRDITLRCVNVIIFYGFIVVGVVQSDENIVVSHTISSLENLGPKMIKSSVRQSIYFLVSILCLLTFLICVASSLNLHSFLRSCCTLASSKFPRCLYLPIYYFVLHILIPLSPLHRNLRDKIRPFVFFASLKHSCIVHSFFLIHHPFSFTSFFCRFRNLSTIHLCVHVLHLFIK